MSRVCNLHPTIHGKKGSVYTEVAGKTVRLTRERLLSGELPQELQVAYGIEDRIVTGDLIDRDDLSWTTVADARQSLGASARPDPHTADILRVAETYEFRTTRKQAKEYQYVAPATTGQLPPMSYTVAESEQPVVTITSDGKETENVAAAGDVIMSGPSGEMYVVKAGKFGGLYDGGVGSTVIPSQAPREVAQYTGADPLLFTAPWGEEMVLKPGDYLVADGESYYRIAQAEYEETYNPPGS